MKTEITFSRKDKHDENTGKPKMAERSTFDDLVSSFYLDLMRGLAAGSLPRRCKNCGHWFVAVGGYNIQYCDKPIPGQAEKGCRSVGAHETAKRKLKEASAKEYARTYNRLEASCPSRSTAASRRLCGSYGMKQIRERLRLFCLPEAFLHSLLTPAQVLRCLTVAADINT